MAGHQAATSVCWSNTRTFPGTSLVTSLAPATNNTNAEIPPAPPPGCRAHCGHSYFHQNYSGPGPSMSTVHCPRQRSQHCVDICVPSFSPDNVNTVLTFSWRCEYIGPAQLCAAAAVGTSPSPPPPRAREELRHAALCWCVITLTGIVNTVVMALSKNTANSNHACV